jgi:hypothetical protein
MPRSFRIRTIRRLKRHTGDLGMPFMNNIIGSTLASSIRRAVRASFDCLGVRAGSEAPGAQELVVILPGQGVYTLPRSTMLDMLRFIISRVKIPSEQLGDSGRFAIFLANGPYRWVMSLAFSLFCVNRVYGIVWFFLCKSTIGYFRVAWSVAVASFSPRVATMHSLASRFSHICLAGT